VNNQSSTQTFVLFRVFCIIWKVWYNKLFNLSQRFQTSSSIGLEIIVKKWENKNMKLTFLHVTSVCELFMKIKTETCYQITWSYQLMIHKIVSVNTQLVSVDVSVRHTTMFVENFKIFDLTHRGLLP
jgi:hypothetical protein